MAITVAFGLYILDLGNTLNKNRPMKKYSTKKHNYKGRTDSESGSENKTLTTQQEYRNVE